MNPSSVKPLGCKNYGSIGHLPNSRLGPGDHKMPDGQAAICTEKARDRHDRIIVTEKLDGSNVGVARIGDAIVALGRAGYSAQTSKYEQHQLFAAWVRQNEQRFRDVLSDGERFVGEWMAQAHGTRYTLRHEPFVIFDLMTGIERAPWDALRMRVHGLFVLPAVLGDGAPLSVDAALLRLGEFGYHGANETPEGAVWRVERRGEFDFMAKYVRPEKKDGCYLPEMSGTDALWHWRITGAAV